MSMTIMTMRMRVVAAKELFLFRYDKLLRVLLLRRPAPNYNIEMTVR
jgi:hypothetical protein